MFHKIWLIIALLALLTACGQTEASPEGQTESPELKEIMLGVGYIPNVQFAPYYVAQAKGFYADEGLDVTMEYGFENDFVALTAKGERHFAVASGDQVILSRSQGLPIVYVMKWYERFPVAVMTTQESGITSPEALAGHKVGIPGMFGASYVAWKALGYASPLDESQVTLESIGFTQAEAVSTGQVDAAVVYIANEPVMLTEQGTAVNVIELSDYIDLVSNGIVTNEETLTKNPALVKGIVQGSLRGLQYTIDHPDEAFELSRTFIPEMSDDDAAIQKKVLAASIELWQSDTPGQTTADAWQTSATFMQETGLIETEVAIDNLYTNQFVEQ